MGLTKLISTYFSSRFNISNYYATETENIQRQLLNRLISSAYRTEYGVKYRFSEITDYDIFNREVPIVEYDDLEPYILQMVNGKSDVLWHGVCRNFAQSSGTSSQRSKYIPITKESFKECHYQGGSDVVSAYLNINRNSHIFDGRSFILGGSFSSKIEAPKGVKVGDLSANLIDNINPLVNLLRVPSKKVALMEDWQEKLPQLVKSSMNANITNISGVPSWFLTVIKEVMKAKGASSIHEVWPNLEVFFHGGISFDPYREQYESICDMSKMHFLETYNASEGFFAVQNSWDTNAMLLLLDIGVFYEFLPMSEWGSEHPHAIPIWEVEKGKTYALIITSNNGLWRYSIGDTVRIESVNPVKIKIAGRTKSYINAFGEELMVHNADEAITLTQKQTGCSVLNYTAAPVYTTEHDKGHHQWLVEFASNLSKEQEAKFAMLLDLNLRNVNSDYDAKRSNDIFLNSLTMVQVKPGLFDKWLKLHGKLGGQRKVPRLCNDRHLVDEMLQINQ